MKNEDEQSITDDAMLTERELAVRWRKSLRSLQRWRAAESAPPYLRIGRTVLYRISDVLAFENARRSGGGAR